MSVTDIHRWACSERVHLVRYGGVGVPHGRTSGTRGGHPLAVASDGGRPRFTSRKTSESLLVVADLRGVVRDDQQTEIDLTDESLILTVGSRFVWRVPVEYDRPSIADVSLHNDILEARVDVETRNGADGSAGPPGPSDE